MNRSESINELTKALSAAQGEIKGAVKDQANPFYRSTYADLQSVWDAIREPMSKNGIAITQFPEERESGLILTTMLSHSSGQWLESSLPVRPGYTDKEGNFVPLHDPQAMGSAITYARRYALQAVAGVAPMDDDGNAASGKGQERAQERTDHRREAEARKQTPQEPVSVGNWKDVVCHIGKPKGPLQGKKLGTLDEGSKAYLLKSLREKDQSRLVAADKRLLAALCIWEGEQGVDQRPPEDKPVTGNVDTEKMVADIKGIMEWNEVPEEVFFQVAHARKWTAADTWQAIHPTELQRILENIDAATGHCVEAAKAAKEGGAE